MKSPSMLSLRIKIFSHKVAEKVRRKFKWYKYECSQCKTIYDRLTGELFDGYGIYGNAEKGYICKLCKQNNHEENDNLECPICHKNTLYTYDWDFLGEYAHYKCKNCKIVFLGSNDLWNYNAVFLHSIRNIMNGIPEMSNSIDRLKERQEAEEKELGGE